MFFRSSAKRVTSVNDELAAFFFFSLHGDTVNPTMQIKEKKHANVERERKKERKTERERERGLCFFTHFIKLY